MKNKKYAKILTLIKNHKYTALSKSHIHEISTLLLKTPANEKDSEAFIIQVFALVYGAIKRALHITPYDSQIYAALAMADGYIIELPTGEGKTVAAVFVAYLYALYSKGVYVLTFNDYLAKRDTFWMKPAYNLLNVSVDYVNEEKTIEERKIAYHADIMYVTVKEAGYDYLKSFLVYDADDIMQRPFYAAIVDEADSIMLDNARIPLIVASDQSYHISLDANLDKAISQLIENVHFKMDDSTKSIYLLENGYDYLEKEFHLDLSAESSMEMVCQIHLQLKARYLLHKDKHYIVRDGEILIIDEFTGRIMKNCKWPDGIQAALELKEKLSVKASQNIINRITIQNFLNLYPTLCGMTGTALSSASEFQAFYQKEVVVIPPNIPSIRIDNLDCVYMDKNAKHKALVDKVIKIHKTQRPILIGTGSIRESEELAQMLMDKQCSVQVLNAKNDEEEAAIIEQAGKINAVTISTNMAGRGVDIRLGGRHAENYEKIASLGGLYIIGTNRHESIRIDDQLRGRCGRQGDPGESAFHISLEDNIFQNCKNKEHLKKSFNNSTSNSKKINKQVRHIQKVVEGRFLDAKISLSRYTALYEKQRKIVHDFRDEILHESITIVNPDAAFAKELHSQLSHQEMSSALKSISLFSINEQWSDHLLYVEQALDEVQVIGKSTADPFIFSNKKIVEHFRHFNISVERKITEICKDVLIENGYIALGKMGIHGPVSTKTYMLFDGSEELNLVNELAAVSSPISALYFVLYLSFKKRWNKYHNT